MNTLAAAFAMEVVTVSALAWNHIIYHENTQFHTVALVISVFCGIINKTLSAPPKKSSIYCDSPLSSQLITYKNKCNNLKYS